MLLAITGVVKIPFERSTLAIPTTTPYLLGLAPQQEPRENTASYPGAR